ncbi:MAG TPA: tripartite tricarboxylate transporter substrate binding protein [Burkholderiales bacterium]|jgi:tripartite-type tricarboxylate transporter receptor subunit TctC|nr:tripartite tricarboxylate transporter substrate binding protein [Burkholderiales bacterium]
MTPARRDFLRLAASAASLSVASRFTWAEGYPSRPVRWVVPFAPGGGTDVVARVMSQRLSERLGQPFVIENRPGAGANIGTEAVVRASPDGYTLLFVASVNAINATLYDKLGFDFIHDIAPVAGIMRVPNVMVVNPSLPARTIPEFIAYAKANPGKINFASAGNGTTQHVAGELFKIMAGIDMLHIPYRGTGPALADLLRGQVQVLFLNPGSSAEYIKAGKLRVLAVTSATRLQAWPDVPAVGEFLPGFEATLFYGLGAPRSTPPDIVGKLNKEVNLGLAEPGIKARLASLDGTVLGGSAADFGELIADETGKWSKVVKLANIRAD